MTGQPLPDDFLDARRLAALRARRRSSLIAVLTILGSVVLTGIAVRLGLPPDIAVRLGQTTAPLLVEEAADALAPADVAPVGSP